MPKTAAKRLTALQVKNFKGAGVLLDGDGLRLVARSAGNRWWSLRMMVAGRSRDYGLGSLADVSLTEARDRAHEMRRAIINGLPPPVWREPEAQSNESPVKTEASATSGPTFRDAFHEFFRLKERRLRNDKHKDQWRSTMDRYVFPKIGSRPVAEITPREIIDVLEPIWERVPETARRVLQRIRKIFDASIVKGDRLLANPTTGVADVLGRERQPQQHHAALPVAEVPKFIAKLRQRQSTIATRLAFEFLILTAARSGEVRLAPWSEIDFEARLWTIPAARMKMQRDHCVPLSNRAIEILREMQAARLESELIFPSEDGGPISNMTFTKCLRDGGYPPERATAHGFRSSFKDWCATVAKVSDQISECALAHVDKDKVRAAYLRTMYLDDRRVLMERWAVYCTSGVDCGDR